MMPAIGDLRRRIAIETASDTPDGAGGMVRAWISHGSVFGAIEPRRRGERVDNGRLAGLVTHRVTMRWRGDVVGGARLVADGTAYRVLAVEDHDPQRRFLDCLCEEEQG
ncbi:phage head closure protein [Acuticoccus sp. M5D2P5]|uniref:phage head closure protein n=1 Tax=Acuticoccus kalidii TaxID=2910977 RepID=UPI001F1C5226|nr:phage head closure protein [Acuticoccus kalidii]MCF3934460.1 phage head closure protein [Acuticoccus kalidii]